MSNPYDNDKGNISSVLGPTLKFKGVLTAEEDLLIKGRVEGSIKHSSSLTIGDGGHVKANVAAEYIVVEGRVEGDLVGSKSVKVRDTAKIDGNIISPSVSLVEGATFNGKIDMDSDPSAKVASVPTGQPKTEAVAVDDDRAEDRDAAEKRKTAAKSKRADKKSASAA